MMPPRTAPFSPPPDPSTLRRTRLRFRHQRFSIEPPAFRGHRVLPHRRGIFHGARGEPADGRDAVPILRHDLVVPVVPRKAFMGSQVGERRAIVLLAQFRSIIFRGRDIEAADTSLFEGRRGIVGGAVDAGAQRRGGG